MKRTKICMVLVTVLVLLVGVVACDAKGPEKKAKDPQATTQQPQQGGKVFTLEDYQRDLAILQIKLDGIKVAKEAVQQQEVNLGVLIQQYQAKVQEMAQAKAGQGKQAKEAVINPQQAKPEEKKADQQ